MENDFIPVSLYDDIEEDLDNRSATWHELYDRLNKYTDGFTKESGKFPLEVKSEMKNAEDILKDKYKYAKGTGLDYNNAEVDGTDYVVEFSDPVYMDEDVLKFMPDKNPENAKLINNQAMADAGGSGEGGGGMGESLLEDIEKHSGLNPDIFEGDSLRPEVKDKLLEVVDKFIENLKEDEIELDVKDIVILGSNASFNYTKDSDIDLHIIADTTNYNDNKDLAMKLYQAYKSLFNNKYDPSIRGHEVEIYVEPDGVNAKSNGIYSLNNGWIKVPDKDSIPEVDKVELEKQLQPYEDRVQDILANPDSSIEDIDNIIDELYVLRQNSILQDGEYGIGNLVFKEIRNQGYLQDLKDKKVGLENKEMTLENLQEGLHLDPLEKLSYYRENRTDGILSYKNILTESTITFYQDGSISKVTEGLLEDPSDEEVEAAEEIKDLIKGDAYWHDSYDNGYRFDDEPGEEIEENLVYSIKRMNNEENDQRPIEVDRVDTKEKAINKVKELGDGYWWDEVNESLLEDEQLPREKFDDYCKDKIEDLGTVEYVNSFGESSDAEVIMIGDIREFDDAKVIRDEDDPENFVCVKDGEVVIDTQMISAPQYAARMEFKAISPDFIRELDEYWFDLDMDDMINDEINESTITKKRYKREGLEDDEENLVQEFAKSMTSFGDKEEAASEIATEILNRGYDADVANRVINRILHEGIEEAYIIAITDYDPDQITYVGGDDAEHSANGEVNIKDAIKFSSKEEAQAWIDSMNKAYDEDPSLSRLTYEVQKLDEAANKEDTYKVAYFTWDNGWVEGEYESLEDAIKKADELEDRIMDPAEDDVVIYCPDGRTLNYNGDEINWSNPLPVDEAILGFADTEDQKHEYNKAIKKQAEKEKAAKDKAEYEKNPSKFDIKADIKEELKIEPIDMNAGGKHYLFKISEPDGTNNYYESREDAEKDLELLNNYYDKKDLKEGQLGHGYEFQFPDVLDTLKVYLQWEGIIGFEDDIMEYKDTTEDDLDSFLRDEGIYGYSNDVWEILQGNSAYCSGMEEDDFNDICDENFVDPETNLV